MQKKINLKLHTFHSQRPFLIRHRTKKTHLRERQHPSARRWEGSDGSRMDVPSEGRKTTTLFLGSAAGWERGGGGGWLENEFLNPR